MNQFELLEYLERHKGEWFCYKELMKLSSCHKGIIMKSMQQASKFDNVKVKNKMVLCDDNIRHWMRFIKYE